VARVSYELTACPVCGTQDSAELADADSIRAEVELLWEFHEHRLKQGVPPEHLADRLAFSQHPPLRLAECLRCSHIYRNPWERKESLASAYTGSAPKAAVLESLHETQQSLSRAQVGRLTAIAGRPGRGLEVGSYAGGFLAAATELGWVFEGVDLSDDVAAFTSGKGLKVTPGEIEDVDPTIPFDAIAIWNTFEQLYDARSALAMVRKRLRPGGVLALRVPNGGFYRVWRKRLNGPGAGLALRLLAHNNLLSFPYRQGFTRGSLTALLELSGFAIVKIFGDTLAPVADRWTTRYGVLEERWIKRMERRLERGWKAPWVEVFARPVG
jgi:SAM-dependent methyltransferase